MYTDTHAHLNFAAFSDNLDETIARATEKKVTAIIIPGTTYDTSLNAINISLKYPSLCYPSIGIHPYHINRYSSDKIREELGLITKIARKYGNIVAIGEVGLDYYLGKNGQRVTASSKLAQKRALIEQIDIAISNSLPVIFHCREAFEDMIPLVEKYVKHRIKGVFHCFSGDRQIMEKVLHMGFYLGFDGNITYKNNQLLRDIVRIVPLDRLLIETDSPYLSPLPLRGKPNECSYIPLIYEEVARIRGEKMDTVTGQTLINTRDLFHI